MERTYVFNQDGNNGNGGGSKFDIMAMLPNLMGSKGVDPGLLALLNQGRGSQDQWGGSWWFIWIILLWFCWGGNGFGNRFGNGGGLPAELNGDVGREYLMSAIQGNGNAINQLASSLNCSTQQLQSALCNIQGLIANVGNQVGMSSQQIINAFQSGNQAVLTQIADCCCRTQNAITTMGYKNMRSCNLNTGITYSNIRNRQTVMVIALTSSPAEFQNSFDHEKGHLCRHISRAFGIDPYGEEAQYLSGYVGQKMFPVAKKFLCEHCRRSLCGK